MNDNRHTDGSGTEPIKNARSSKESVEDGWKSELVDGGVDEARAEDIVSMLQSSTELVLGSPSEDEVDEALRTAIEEADLEQYGAEQPRRLTSALLRVLDEWQDGTRASPVAAAPRTAPTAWDDRTNGETQRTGGTAHATGADETTHEDGTAETPDDPDAEESVTTVQGDPISPDPDLEPQADPGQEGIAGGAGPINDEQGVVEDAVDATRDAGTQASAADDSSAATDTPSAETAQPEGQADQSGGTGADDSTAADRHQQIDLAKTIAHIQFDRNEDVINSWTEQPAELVEDEITSFAVSAVNVYRDMVKNTLFPEMSDSEQELLYEKLVEDRIREQWNSE
jgi:hypothetical protein